MRHLPQTHRFALLLGGAALLCVIAGGVALALRPRQFTTRQEAISYTLSQHDVAYRQVSISRVWPSITYNAGPSGIAATPLPPADSLLRS